MGAAIKFVLCQMYGKDEIKKQGIKGKTSRSLEHKRRISLLYGKMLDYIQNLNRCLSCVVIELSLSCREVIYLRQKLPRLICYVNR